MLKISQIKLPVQHTEKQLEEAVRKQLRLPEQTDISYSIVKQSLDARHKPSVFYIYSVEVQQVKNGRNILREKDLFKRARNQNVQIIQKECYQFPTLHTREELLARSAGLDKDKAEEDRPVIIGFGPAGIFAALKLAQAGYAPVVYERGEQVADRKNAVEQFWESGRLNPESNVQFGEGGAGTFSDGKLNTQIGDKSGRIRQVLEDFVAFGADSSILFHNKPHIGTDVLGNVIPAMRQEIIRLGGEVHFHTKLEQIVISAQRGDIQQILLTDTRTGEKSRRNCRQLCLAVGHSARDTFEMLLQSGIIMEPKAFAVGLRMEHPQQFIDRNAYGQLEYAMPAADYKLTCQTENGRGVYSFCMCPGGYVVNASSEKERLAVNGMSYSGRNGVNANSAMIVTVTPQDFGTGILDGMHFQRHLEELAYRTGQGQIPVQLLADFRENRVSSGFGTVQPQTKGKHAMGNLREILPPFVSQALLDAMPYFDHKIHGFNREDAVLSGVESRTSSPVRIVRNAALQASVRGLYPCGEGAGYAGGITSAAVDGIKVAEAIVRDFETA